MRVLHSYVSLFVLGSVACFDIFQPSRLYIYNFTGKVEAGARNEENSLRPTNWIITGLFQLQRIDSTTIAAWIIPHGEVHFSPSGDSSPKLMEYDEHMRAPFKILTGNGAINYVAVNGKEPLWITNIKRAFAASFQIQAHNFGLLKITEGTIHGFCETEYLVTNKTSHYHIRKTVNLNTCTTHPGGIHYVRSNIPPMNCKTNTLRKIIVSNDATYDLKPHESQGVYVSRVVSKGTTMVNIFEATGSAQYIVSSLEFNHIKEKLFTNNQFDVQLDGNSLLTSLEYLSHRDDPTGGRSTPSKQDYIDQIIYLLNYLTDNLETRDTINFREPIDSHVSEMFRLMSLLNLEMMEQLFAFIDRGTSYRQETIRNIFLEILPRIGTAASVLLTRDIIVNKQVKSTTAVQLLISLPFHIDELSEKLVHECEPFLTLGNISPDVRQAGVLTYSILIHNTYMAGKISTDEFERYVKRFFDYFLSSVDYEQQMLYINAMANLQQGNVAEYLEPIIKASYPQNTDIRFLAIMATLPLAQTRPEKSYEIYWPIFESRETPLQLRIGAFIMLLHSNPTPARLMSIHEVMQTEECPHMLNFYITTLQSLKKTTYPCYQQLKEVIGFMSRHLPKKADTRYWSTGMYLFDYIHDSGIGGMFSSMLIADENTNIPHIGMIDVKTEALGKYTGQLSLYLKVRGVTDMFYKKQSMDFSSLGLRDILRNLKLNTVSDIPLHFELILQMEGKSVLSFYLNQTSFDSLPQGELTNRLTAVLFGDTHINLQSFRWPFVNKYSVPTVLGTPAEVLIETTVATTVRGNITNVLKELKRNQQIDMRYSSYSQCQSLIYNPFLNFEHQIKQEQGFLGYLPMNMELQFNAEKKNIELAFILAKDTETGFALKSRLSRGIYEFLLLGENSKNRSQVIFEESEADLPISVFNQEIKDLGLNFEFDIGYKGLYRNVFNPTENWFVDKNLGGLDENGHSRFIGNYILQLINIGHVSATHLGNNKYVKCVISNPEDTRLVWRLEDQSNGQDTEFEVYAFELGLEQYNTLKIAADQMPNHKWSGMMKVRMHHSSMKTITTQVIFKRITGNDEWRLCLENNYNPLIFTKKPENFNMLIFFGAMDPAGNKKCPEKSKLKISGSFNIHPGVENIMGEMKDDDVNEQCPKKLIYFNPPILRCDKFNTLTKVTDYQFNVTATNMPQWYTLWMRRLEQLYTSFTTGVKPVQDWENQINMMVTSPVGHRFMNLSINGVNSDVLDIANVFNSDHDVKHHTMVRIFEEYGFLHSCSVVGNNVIGYNDLRANLDDYVTSGTNCSILLAADCSRKSSFAIFIEPVEGFKLKDKFAIRYFVGETSVLVSPNDKENIIVENLGVHRSREVVKMRNRNFEMKDKEYLQFSNFYFSEENILIIEHKLFETKIQYNMENLLQISTKFWLQNKVCGGVCTSPRVSKQQSPAIKVNSYCFV